MIHSTIDDTQRDSEKGQCGIAVPRNEHRKWWQWQTELCIEANTEMCSDGATLASVGSLMEKNLQSGDLDFR
jgi:hypothetical protein